VAQSGLTVINTIAVLILTPVVAFYLLLDWEAMVKDIDDLLRASIGARSGRSSTRSTARSRASSAGRAA